MGNYGKYLKSYSKYVKKGNFLPNSSEMPPQIEKNEDWAIGYGNRAGKDFAGNLHRYIGENYVEPVLEGVQDIPHAASPYAEERTIPNQEWDKLSPLMKVLSQAYFTIAKAGTAIPGFLYQGTKPLVRNDIEQGESAPEQLQGFITMLRQLGPQIQHLGTGAVGLAPGKEIAEQVPGYVDAVNALFEAPESPAFALAMLKGVGPIGNKIRSDPTTLRDQSPRVATEVNAPPNKYVGPNALRNKQDYAKAMYEDATKNMPKQGYAKYIKPDVKLIPEKTTERPPEVLQKGQTVTGEGFTVTGGKQVINRGYYKGSQKGAEFRREESPYARDARERVKKYEQAKKLYDEATADLPKEEIIQFPEPPKQLTYNPQSFTMRDKLHGEHWVNGKRTYISPSGEEIPFEPGKVKGGRVVKKYPEAIAKDLGIKYDGVQEGIGYQFTDPSNGGTFYVKNLADVPTKLAEKKAEFAKSSESVGKSEQVPTVKPPVEPVGELPVSDKLQMQSEAIKTKGVATKENWQLTWDEYATKEKVGSYPLYGGQKRWWAIDVMKAVADGKKVKSDIVYDAAGELKGEQKFPNEIIQKYPRLVEFEQGKSIPRPATSKPGDVTTGKGKEAWETLREDYVGEGSQFSQSDLALKRELKAWEKRRKEPNVSMEAIDKAIVKTQRKIDLSNTHRKLVEQALSEGKPVTPEVLADYPDLKPVTSKPVAEKAGGTIKDGAWNFSNQTRKSLLSDIEYNFSFLLDKPINEARAELLRYKPEWETKLAELKEIAIGKKDPVGKVLSEFRNYEGRTLKSAIPSDWAEKVAIPQTEAYINSINKALGAVEKIDKKVSSKPPTKGGETGKNLGRAAFMAAGLQIDDDGKMKFDPARAALGMALGLGKDKVSKELARRKAERARGWEKNKTPIPDNKPIDIPEQAKVTANAHIPDFENAIVKEKFKLVSKVPEAKDINVFTITKRDFWRNTEKVFGKGEAFNEIVVPLEDAKKSYVDMQENLIRDHDVNIQRNLGIKPGSRMDRAVQEFGEGRRDYNWLIKKFGDKRAARIIKAAAWYRQKYETLLADINETRQRLYPNDESKLIRRRKDYFRHFRDITGFGGLMNIFETPAGIPAELVGVSEFTKPRSKFLEIAQRRLGDKTDLSAAGGFANYIRQAAYAKNIDPQISRLRELRKQLTEASKETNNINNYLRFLDEYTNSLAGKTNRWDRAIQDYEVGRKVFRTIDWVNKRVKANVIVGNAGAMVAQFFNIQQGIAEAGKYSLPGLRDSFAQIFVESEAMKKSSFLKERYFDSAYNKFHRGMIHKATDMAAWMLKVGDEISTKFTWNSFYRKALGDGIADPIRYADRMTRKMVGGRGVGEVPLIQQSKIFQMIAPFQLEVGNALWALQDMALGPKPIRKLATFMVASWLMNRVAEQVRGNPVSIDPIQALIEGIQVLNDEKLDTPDKLMRAPGRIAGELLSNVPLGQTVAAMYPEYGLTLAGKKMPTRKQLFGSNDPTRFGSGILILKGLQDPAYKLLPPFGGVQLKKTIQGLQAYDKGKVTDKKGRKLYNIPQTPENLIKTGLFGKYSTKEAREYFEKRK